MYQAPVAVPAREDTRVSTSLSVYDDESVHRGTISSSHLSHMYQYSRNSDPNSGTRHSGGSTTRLSYDGGEDHDNYIPNEISSQTVLTYMTASQDLYTADHSFTSINESILGDHLDQDTANVTLEDLSLDTDKTPKIPQVEHSSDADATPIIDQNPSNQPQLSPKLPAQELSSKFKRLSVTLQHSRTSGHSHQFMNSFQQNVDRSNKQSPRSSRNARSDYFKNIHKTVGTSPRRSDGESENFDQASLADNSSYNDDTSHMNTANTTTIMSNRFPVLRQEEDEDIPVRQDLIQKYDELSTVGNSELISTKEKNDMYIQSSQGYTSLSDNYPHGLNIVNAEIYESKERSPQRSRKSIESTPEESLSSLFVRALHPFDASTLQSESDVSICLSFNKDSLAFVHTIDESGWGEVTLVETLERGWIPMNYFSMAIVDENIRHSAMSEDELKAAIPNSHFLKPLFHACSAFLVDPLSHRTRNGNYTFSIKVINSIRDGVRLLLQETNCLSRSNEIVTKMPVVRKCRKSLLADWYTLMVKANEFKGTSDYDKIEILTLLVFQVTTKATNFLQVWSIESTQIAKQENEKKVRQDIKKYPLLSTPPLAKRRVTEINGLLYSYLSLIIGRLDLVEHNPIGTDVLETLIHQIILFLRELLFVSKSGSEFASEKPSDLDSSLDTLLSLVSDLVDGVKKLVTKTMAENNQSMILLNFKESSDYLYTEEGKNLIQIASKIVRSISKTVLSIFKLLEFTGDFKLTSERSYPDYSKMRITPEEFIKKCSIGIAKTNSIKGGPALKSFKPSRAKRSNRYSLIRSGKPGDLGFTQEGASTLHNVLSSQEESTPFSVSISEFEPFTNTEENVSSNIQDELLVDEKGNLLGGSFRGLVYTLTNENAPPDYFFVSTLFICYRSFATSLDLTEELITRFDVADKIVETQTKDDVSLEIRVKNRRRLIIKMFQLWMESYWNQEQDYNLLTTFINFFNEGVSKYLPLEAMKLIDIAVKLTTRPMNENRTVQDRLFAQLVSRSITSTKANRKSVFTSIDQQFNSRYSMVDGYELSKINTNSSTTSSLKSMTLPMPLGIGNQTSGANTLLSKTQLHTIEKVNMTYRAILGTNWCPEKRKENIPTTYFTIDLATLLPNWFEVCDQSWVLSNYKPNLLDFNGLEVAKQLTLIESHIFCSIKPDELLNENFTTKRAYLKLAPNVRQSLLFTNCLSAYVLESILSPDISPKKRVNLIKTWLKIAISCLYLRNFNSLAAIITSLQSHLVTRLSKVWEDLSTKYQELYDYLSSIIHPEKNYNVYRTKMRNFLISNDYNIPVVPYFSLFLQDLTFLADGNPKYRKANTFLNQKLINIDKYLKITRVIADIESLQIPYAQSKPNTAMNRRSSILSIGSQKTLDIDDYNIIPVISLQEFILLELWKVCQLNKHEEDRAWKLSLNIQPRE